jgi:hypothetical protein
VTHDALVGEEGVQPNHTGQFSSNRQGV